MTRSFDFLALTVAVGFLVACGSEAPEAQTEAAMGPPSGVAVDLEAVAHTLVTRNAQVQEGEFVLISGSPRDLELMENLAVQVRRLGAHPLISIQTERIQRRMWDEVPERFDTQRYEWGWRLADIVDWHIALDVGESPDLLADVPMERMAAQAEANTGLESAWAQRGAGLVEVGNNLYPTRERAERFGLPQAELARLFWEGILADPSEVRAVANSVRESLTGARVLHITHPNGTDLRVPIEGRDVRMADGALPEDREARIAEGAGTWLPAGEVYLSVVPGGAEGRVVVDRFFMMGEEIQGLDLQFEDGVLTEMQAASGWEMFQSFWESGPPGKERLTVIDLGVNPGITSQRLLTWSVSGMVTVFLGNDAWAGGELDIPFGAPFHLPGTTVRADDRVIVEDGVLRP